MIRWKWNDLEQWAWCQLGTWLQMIGIQLVLTCRFCDEELEADNFARHMQWHRARGDKKL